MIRLGIGLLIGFMFGIYWNAFYFKREVQAQCHLSTTEEVYDACVVGVLEGRSEDQ